MNLNIHSKIFKMMKKTIKQKTNNKTSETDKKNKNARMYPEGYKIHKMQLF